MPPLVGSALRDDALAFPGPGFVFPGSGGPGIAGQFTFSADGETEIVGYLWGTLSPTEFVGADTLGGPADHLDAAVVRSDRPDRVPNSSSI
jgi:hypothetical protein